MFFSLDSTQKGRFSKGRGRTCLPKESLSAPSPRSGTVDGKWNNSTHMSITVDMRCSVMQCSIIEHKNNEYFFFFFFFFFLYFCFKLEVGCWLHNTEGISLCMEHVFKQNHRKFVCSFIRNEGLTLKRSNSKVNLIRAVSYSKTGKSFIQYF